VLPINSPIPIIVRYLAVWVKLLATHPLCLELVYGRELSFTILP